MNRSPAQSSLPSIQESLRQDPKYSGVPDEVLTQIATLVRSSTSKKILASLRSVQLFEALADEDVARIQELGETVEMERGEVLFEEGTKGDSFYIVLRGKVELVKRARDGSEKKLAVVRAGETFGEMALLNQSPRSATARAIEPTALLELSRTAFESMLGKESFAVRMLRGVAKALWATSVRFASSQTKGADARDVLRTLSQVMQKSMLPTAIPQIPGFSVMGTTGNHEKVEGDSAWDVFRLGDGRWVFASLRAHSEGLPAGSSLVLARTLVRELGRDQHDLGRLLVRVNEAMIAAKVPGARQHVECALIALEQDDLTWAAAGSVAAAIVRAGGSVVDLPAGAPPLGASPTSIYRTGRVSLMTGDTFLTVTRSVAGGLAKAKVALGDVAGADARELVRRVSDALPVDDAITGDVFENTIVVIKRVDQPVAQATPAG